MALWRSRTLNIEQRAKLEEDQQNQGLSSVQIEDTEIVLNFGDINLSEAYSSEVSLHVSRPLFFALADLAYIIRFLCLEEILSAFSPIMVVCR